jgi:hypothetical protein
VWIFKHASAAQLQPMAPVILRGLLKLLADGGPEQGDAQVKQLRAFTYQALGQLAHREPKLFRCAAPASAGCSGVVSMALSTTGTPVLPHLATCLCHAPREEPQHIPSSVKRHFCSDPLSMSRDLSCDP